MKRYYVQVAVVAIIAKSFLVVVGSAFVVPRPSSVVTSSSSSASSQKCSLKKGGGLLPSRPDYCILQRTSVATGVVTSSALTAKLWDQLRLEEDPEPMWYLLNCVPGNEMALLRQCREVCADLPNSDDIKFVVPTEQKTRSHGANRMVTETKVKYPGYVFGKLRLGPDTYEAIQGLDLCRSWMGTVHRRGYRKLPPAPVALNELEVENFGLEDIDDTEEEEEQEEKGKSSDDMDIILDDEAQDAKDASSNKGVDKAALKVYQGLEVDDMVKVTAKGKFYNEDGIVRRLKDGRIFVRFYTYGSLFEEWLDPGDLRKLSNMEILKGLSGPSQPITQRDLDGPSQYEYNSRYANYEGRNRQGGGDLRRSLMSNVQGGGRGGPRRNRRQDRTASRYSSRNRDRDFFGRTQDERRREEDNWKWYQDQQQQQRQTGGSSSGRSREVATDGDWSIRAGSRQQDDDDDDDWALGDVDSQWGRKSQRQQRRERSRVKHQRNRQDNRRVEAAIGGDEDWSAFVSPAVAPSSSSESDSGSEDDFFDSLMTDLSKDLKSSSSDARSQSRAPSATSDKQDEDEFFASLMSDLKEATTIDEPTTRRKSSSPGRVESSTLGDDADDFFASLEQELDGDAFQDVVAGSSSAAVDSDDESDDFFSKLDAELATTIDEDIVVETSTVPDKRTGKAPQAIPDSSSPLASSKAQQQQPAQQSSSDNLEKLTVPVLKDMLREKGLKVSGRKAELIERLKSN